MAIRSRLAMKTHKPKAKYVEKTKAFKRPAKRVAPGSPRVSTELMRNIIQKPRAEQFSMLDALHGDQSTRAKLKIENIDEVGANLSTSGWRATFAVSRLATNQGLYLEADKQRRSKQPINPTDIVISQNEYFAAYGLKRSRNNKGSLVYSGSEKADAIRGLMELTKPVIQHYTRSKDNGRHDVATKIEGLVSTERLELDVTTRRRKEIMDGDLSGGGARGSIHWRIKPSEIFYLSSFMHLPDALFRRLEELDGKRVLTPALCKQVIVLALHVHHNPDKKTYRNQLDTFLSNTGKNKLLEKRQRNRAVKETAKDLAKLKKVGGVAEHRIINDERNGRFIEIDVIPEAFA